MEITPKEFLEMELKDFKLTIHNPEFVALARQTANFLKSINPGKILDFGSGTGVYSEIMRQEGLEVVAMDIWPEHREYCQSQYPLLKLTDKPEPATTMVWIEVAEHMTDQEIVKALMDVKPEKVLFSSTPEKTPNDHLWGHINIKTEEEWIDCFRSLGFEFKIKPDTPTTWALYFERMVPWG